MREVFNFYIALDNTLGVAHYQDISVQGSMCMFGLDWWDS